MAAAAGQILDIPIIIRSLSRDFYRSAIRKNYSIGLDREFLLALDTGIIAAAAHPTAAGFKTAAGYIINRFHNSWWSQDSFESNSIINENHFLQINNIDECLEFHRREIISFPPASSNTSSFTSKPNYIWKPEAAEPITQTDRCRRCRLYRAVAMGTLDEHRDIRNQVQGMETVFATQKQQALRRASGFNQLFEYLSIKEHDPTAAASVFPNHDVSHSVTVPDSIENESLRKIRPQSKKGGKFAVRRAAGAATRKSAIADLKKVENVPSLKWTWGVDMDHSDLPALHRSIDLAKRLPHSGYDTSLLQGSDTRSMSSLTHDVLDFENGYFSDVGDEVRRAVPDLNSRDIPSCLRVRLNKTPSRYLKHLRDDSVEPMDDILSTVQAAVPYIVPAPPRPRDVISSTDPDNSKTCCIFLFGSR